MPTPPTPEPRRRAFGEALRDALSLAGWSQEALGQELGVKQTAVSQWVTGSTAPGAATVFAIEQVLDLEPGSLSQHLGYLPLDAVKTVTSTKSAIMNDPGLSVDEKSMLLAAYEAARKRR